MKLLVSKELKGGRVRLPRYGDVKPTRTLCLEALRESPRDLNFGIYVS